MKKKTIFIIYQAFLSVFILLGRCSDDNIEDKKVDFHANKNISIIKIICSTLVEKQSRFQCYSIE